MTTYQQERWSLEALFPGHETKEFKDAMSGLEGAIESFELHRSEIDVEIDKKISWTLFPNWRKSISRAIGCMVLRVCGSPQIPRTRTPRLFRPGSSSFWLDSEIRPSFSVYGGNNWIRLQLTG